MSFTKIWLSLLFFSFFLSFLGGILITGYGV